MINSKGLINVSGNLVHNLVIQVTKVIEVTWSTLKNTDAWVPHPEILMQLVWDVDSTSRFFKAPQVVSDSSYGGIACIGLPILLTTITNSGQNKKHQEFEGAGARANQEQAQHSSGLNTKENRQWNREQLQYQVKETG